jgi:hypothetical protein
MLPHAFMLMLELLTAASCCHVVKRSSQLNGPLTLLFLAILP